MEARQRLLIKAATGDQVGTGHVMRCLALAQEWRRRGGEATFVATRFPTWIRSRLRVEGFGISSAGGSPSDLHRLVRAVNPAWILLDVGPRIHEFLVATAATKTAVLDDHGGRFPVGPSLIINQNADDDAGLYEVPDHTLVLMGIRYVLLRNEFLRNSGAAREIPTRCRVVLLTLGGSDASGLVPGLADALSHDSPFRLRAIVTSSHRHLRELHEMADRTPTLEVLQDASDMAELMRSADLAVSSGGATVWELASQGVPALVGASSPYEDIMVERLRQLDLFHVLGRFRDLEPADIVRTVMRFSNDPSWRARMSERAATLVDGLGRSRVTDEMWERL